MANPLPTGTLTASGHWQPKAEASSGTSWRWPANVHLLPHDSALGPEHVTWISNFAPLVLTCSGTDSPLTRLILPA